MPDRVFSLCHQNISVPTEATRASGSKSRLWVRIRPLFPPVLRELLVEFCHPLVIPYQSMV